MQRRSRMEEFVSWVGRRPSRSLRSGSPGRRRLRLSQDPDVVYAVGDVHGCLKALIGLERQIVEDARRTPGLKLIVMLGDYIDRGPDSARVLDHLGNGPPDGLARVCLIGNHDQALLDLLSNPAMLSSWLDVGGVQTMASFGLSASYLQSDVGLDPKAIVDLLAGLLPDEHLLALENLPICLQTPSYLFAHAGMRPGLPLEEQRDEDLISIRQDFTHAPPGSFDRMVVHGHTIVRHGIVSGNRVSVDTGAYLGGPLTAARLDAAGVSFLAEPSFG